LSKLELLFQNNLTALFGSFLPKEEQMLFLQLQLIPALTGLVFGLALVALGFH
jgi:hypothetical protein